MSDRRDGCTSSLHDCEGRMPATCFKKTLADIESTASKGVLNTGISVHMGADVNRPRLRVHRVIRESIFIHHGIVMQGAMENTAHCLDICFGEDTRAEFRKVLVLTVTGEWREQRHLDIIVPDGLDLDDGAQDAATKSVEDAFISGCVSQALAAFKRRRRVGADLGV
ncbi:unnamed protein product [Prorocentrum cordatum]|uniref:Uncharacterized protein n=1 Tax=Prorocentrum cordatum TaxID=2364126 RepID=A0ABN9YH33_9DINO|nr:unnamed protein product [Polarella glacialis]